MLNPARPTLSAAVEAMLPATPDLAADRGPEHGPGGLAVDLEVALDEALSGVQAAPGPLRRVTDTVPYALLVALLLEVAALELALRRGGQDGLARRDGIPTRGPFTWLSRRDRLRAMRLLEDDGLLPWLDRQIGRWVPYLGTVAFLVQGLHTLAAMAYYSEWCADGEPSPETVQGWRQTDYPGPADGHAALRGYEVEAFAEDEY